MGWEEKLVGMRFEKNGDWKWDENRMSFEGF